MTQSRHLPIDPCPACNKPVFLHDSRNSLFRNRVTLTSHELRNLRATIDTARLFEVIRNDVIERFIFEFPSTCSSTPPGVVAVAGYLIKPAHDGDAVICFILVYEFEDFSFCSKENWMAFFKRPCSCLSRLCSRSSFWRRFNSARIFGSISISFFFTMSCPLRVSNRQR